MLPKQGYSTIFSPTTMPPVFITTAFTQVTTWAAKLPAFRSVFNRIRLDRFSWSIEPLAKAAVSIPISAPVVRAGASTLYNSTLYKSISYNEITNRVVSDIQQDGHSIGFTNNNVLNQYEQKVQQGNQYHQHWHNQHPHTLHQYNTFQDRGNTAAGSKELNKWDHGTLLLSKPNDGLSIFETNFKTKRFTTLAPKASLEKYTKVIKTLQRTHSKIQPFTIIKNIQKNHSIQKNNIKSRYQQPNQKKHTQASINESRVFQLQDEQSIAEEEKSRFSPVDACLWSNYSLKKKLKTFSKLQPEVVFNKASKNKIPKIEVIKNKSSNNKSLSNKIIAVSAITQIKKNGKIFDTKNQSVLWPIHSAHKTVYQDAHADAHSRNYHGHNQNKAGRKKTDSTKIDSTKTDQRLSLVLNVRPNSKGHYALANQSNALAGHLKGTSTTLKNKYQPLSHTAVAPKMLMQHLLDRTQPLPWAIHNDAQLEKKQVSFFPHNMNSVGAHKASDSERDSENNLHALKDEIADLKHTLVQWQETLQAQQQQLQQQSQQHLQTLVSSVSQPKQTIRSMNHRPVHAPSFFDPL